MEGNDNDSLLEQEKTPVSQEEKTNDSSQIKTAGIIYGTKKKDEYEFNPETPFGTVEIDPFKPVGWKKPEEPVFSVFSGNAKKCPGCGANLTYNADARQLLCKTCGNVYDAASMDIVGSLAVGNPEVDYETEDDIDYQDKNLSEVVCNSCGSQVVTDSNTASTMCPFCGSPMLVMRKLTRQFRPDAILPFEFDKEEAIRKFTNHVKSIPQVPAPFKSKNVIKKIQGVYVPFWILSSDVHMDIGGNAYYVIDGSSRFDIVKHEEVGGHAMSAPVDGIVDFSLKNIPFDGSKKISNRLMEAVEPFDLSKLVPFKASYLHGYSAEKYDSQPKDMYDHIRKRMDYYAHAVAEQVQFEDCDHFQYNSDYTDIKYSNFKIIYCLLPIYFLNVRYNDNDYQFAINGESGEVCGAIPYSGFWEAINDLKMKLQTSSIGMFRSLRSMVVASIGSASGLAYFGLRLTMRRSLYGRSSSLGMFLLILSAFLFLAGFSVPAIMSSAEKKLRDKVSENSVNPHNLDKRPDASFYLDTTQKISAKKKLTSGGTAGINMGTRINQDPSNVGGRLGSSLWR